MRRSLVAGACAAAAVMGVGPATAARQRSPAPARILVGPNVLASGDGDIPHVESIIAVNPTSSKNLVGTAIARIRSGSGYGCRSYATFDGGATWTYADFPGQVRDGGVDPQIAFGPTGEAYAATLDAVTGMQVHRSADGGRTWQMIASLKRGYDHEQMVIDNTGGRFNGRIYIAAVHGPFGPPERHRIAVFRSEDGRTFAPPVDAAGRDSTGLNVTNNILVLSDGTLVVPYAEWSSDTRVLRRTQSNPELLVTSTDGGVTFSAPTKVTDVHFGPEPDSAHRTIRDKFDVFTFPAFAADVHGTKFRDRIYMVWRDRRNGRSQLMLTYSTDHGRTWPAPTPVLPELPPNAAQFQPAIAVNRDGVVGILWFGTPASGAMDQYDAYVTASLDGGRTFLPPARVSSAPSHPISAGNAVPQFNFESSRGGGINVNTISAVSRWPEGGDYIGLTSDADGDFHAFWPDSRSGTSQLWTARVRVTTADRQESTGDAHLLPAVLDSAVAIDFDAGAAYSAATRRATIPVRLRNVSSDTLYGPFTVQIDRVAGARLVNGHATRPGDAPSIDYSTSLRDWPALEPGGVTEARNWTVEFPGPDAVRLDIKASVRGFRKTRGPAARANDMTGGTEDDRR